MSDAKQPSPPGASELDVIVVGAGLSGLYLLHRLRALGFSVQVLEAAAGVGGTWYWNRYPGARCDVPISEYQYGFDDQLVQEWTWTERYATQGEILRYMEHVADRLDLRRDIRLETRVTAAVFDEVSCRWTVETDRGERLSARWCVMATGCLSAPRVPDFAGLDSFEGDWYHTGFWPHEGVDFTGKRVGVVGTGSSAIQAIPIIAEQAAQLTVFQRTPNFTVPARNHPSDPAEEQAQKAAFAEHRRKARESTMGISSSWTLNDTSALAVGDEEREREFEARWAEGGFGFVGAFSDLLTRRDANRHAAEFAHAKIRATVRDPAVAELLCPKDHPFASKRLCVDTDYFATYNRDNVTLVDVRSTPIEAITPTGLRTRDAEYELDAIVFATGFDAMTGALLDVDIHGRAGRTLREKWAAGPRTYLGIQTAGFPNLFMVTGPGSPSVLSNMIVSIEEHVEWIAACIAAMRERGVACIEATEAAEDEWVEHVNEVAETTLFPEADSWYIGANIPGKPRVFMPYVGGVGRYRTRIGEVAANGYEGFALTLDAALSKSPA